MSTDGAPNVARSSVVVEPVLIICGVGKGRSSRAQHTFAGVLFSGESTAVVGASAWSNTAFDPSPPSALRRTFLDPTALSIGFEAGAGVVSTLTTPRSERNARGDLPTQL